MPNPKERDDKHLDNHASTVRSMETPRLMRRKTGSAVPNASSLTVSLKSLLPFHRLEIRIPRVP